MNSSDCPPLTEEQMTILQPFLEGRSIGWLTAEGSANWHLLSNWANLGWFELTERRGTLRLFNITPLGLSSLRKAYVSGADKLH